jgi:hypothetical protein
LKRFLLKMAFSIAFCIPLAPGKSALAPWPSLGRLACFLLTFGQDCLHFERMQVQHHRAALQH